MRKKLRASIVVLSWNGWNVMHRQLMDMNTMMPDDCELVWIDNGSTEAGFKAGADWWKYNFCKEMTYRRFDTNQGFQTGNNEGLMLATGEIIIVMNPDVKIMNKNFVDEFEKIFLETPDAVVGDRLINWKAGWNELNGKAYPYLEGYVIGALRNTWKALGGFDERYTPANMEDVDLSMTAHYYGFPLIELPHGNFYHNGGQSFAANKVTPEERMSLTQINKKKFDQKWSKILSSEEELLCHPLIFSE